MADAIHGESGTVAIPVDVVAGDAALTRWTGRAGARASSASAPGANDGGVGHRRFNSVMHRGSA